MAAEMLAEMHGGHEEPVAALVLDSLLYGAIGLRRGAWLMDP